MTLLDQIRRFAAMPLNPTAVRVAPDLWEDLHREFSVADLRSPPALFGLPVTVDPDLAPGEWKLVAP